MSTFTIIRPGTGGGIADVVVDEAVSLPNTRGVITAGTAWTLPASIKIPRVENLLITADQQVLAPGVHYNKVSDISISFNFDVPDSYTLHLKVIETTGTGGGGGGTPSATNEITHTLLAGTAIPSKRVVYLSSSNAIMPATSANTTHANKVIGFTKTSVVSGEDVEVQAAGEINNPLWNLTPGGAYYLGEGGEITLVAPTEAGAFAQQVGIAKNSSVLIITIGTPIINL